MSSSRLTTKEIDKLVHSLEVVTKKHPELSFPQRFMRAQNVLPPSSRYVTEVIYQRRVWAKELRDAIQAAGLWPEERKKKQSRHQRVIELSDQISQTPPEPQPVQVREPTTQELIDQLYQRIHQEFDPHVVNVQKIIHEEVKNQLSQLLLATREADKLDSEHQEQRQTVVQLIERRFHKVSIPRLFIVGLIPPQVMVLRQKIADMNVDVKFWKDEAQSKLYDGIAWADDVIVMSKFISHSSLHAVTKKDREKLRYCNGAVSELERQIRFKHKEYAVA